jgi:glycerate-2-kinase
MPEADRNTPIDSILDIFYKAYSSASISQVMQRSVSISGGRLVVMDDAYPLDSFHRIFLAGAGIAAIPMAKYLSGILHDRISQGILLVPPGFGEDVDKIKVCEVTSPLVDQASLKAVKDLLFILEPAGENDLVILLQSKGSGEALELLHPGIAFREYSALVQKLRMAGAQEEEIDSIRMHLSQVKGGQIINAVSPATLISLILSDQPGGDVCRTFLSPTCPDPTTFQHCRELLIRYKLPMKVPPEVLNHLSQGMQGKVPETIKPDDKRLSRVSNYVLHHSSTLAVDAMSAAEELRYSSTILSTHVEGDAFQVGRFFGSVMLDMAKNGVPLMAPCALIASGRLSGSEENRLEKCCEAGLSAASKISGISNGYFLAGTSFQFEENGPVGCIVDGNTLLRLHKSGVSPQDLLAQGRATQGLKSLGQVFPGNFSPNDCGDLFIMMIS